MNDNPFAPPRPDADATPAGPAPAPEPSMHDTAPLPRSMGDTAPLPVSPSYPPAQDGGPGEETVPVQPPAYQRAAPQQQAARTQAMPVAHDAAAVFAAPSHPAPASFPPAQHAPHYGPPGGMPPQPPQHGEAAPRPGRVSKGAVALIAASALVLGAGAGFGGAALYDQVNGDAPVASGGSATSTLPTSSSSTIARTDENTVAAIASAVMPSVVSIENIQGGQEVGEGSGFVIREDGYILTNNHVVEGSDGDTVTVVMSDGQEYAGDVVGATPEYDLAVVKIDKDGLTPLVLGDSDALVVGDDVIAVGSPLGLESTVTTGIVSALHRPVTAGDTGETFIDAIQTDAAINPGNSGGPLINSQGEVIGINSAIASLSSSSLSQSGSVGLGFAITSNQARVTAEQLIADGEATYPVVGVYLDQRYTGEGIRVAEDQGDQSAVAAGGPADLAGIKPGDVITAIDGRVVTRSDELIVAIRSHQPGDTITLTVRRNGSDEDIDVTLAANNSVSYEDQGDSGTDEDTTE